MGRQKRGNDVAKNPPKEAGKRGVGKAMSLTWKHVFPWAWQHTILLMTGMVSSGYDPKSEVPFDAAPDEPADESYAHTATETPTKAADAEPAMPAPPADGPGQNGQPLVN